MNDKEIFKKYEDKWILYNRKNNKVLYSDDDMIKVSEESEKEKYNSYKKLIIVRILKPGTLVINVMK